MLSSAISSAFILLSCCSGIFHRKFIKFVTLYLVIKFMICHNFIRFIINVCPKITKASHYIGRLFDDFSPCSTMQHIHSMTVLVIWYLVIQYGPLYLGKNFAECSSPFFLYSCRLFVVEIMTRSPIL
jgi:hypothetical protein